MPLSELRKLIGVADAVECKTCGVFVARERAKRVIRRIVTVLMYNPGSEEEFYCRAHAPVWDESQSFLYYPPRYYRHRVACDEHGTPVGYAKAEPPAKAPEAGR